MPPFDTNRKTLQAIFLVTLATVILWFGVWLWVNGNAVVAAIADAGPAAWTGKHFGGSPEVMDYLGGPRYKKGPVILFFVDDPESKVPLGPVEYNTIDLANVGLKEV